MESITDDLRQALDDGRVAISGALSRDRGRLHGLWSRWRGKPADAELRARFEQALAASVAACRARAEGLPQVTLDPALPITAEAERIVELVRQHQVVVVAGETGSGKTTQLPKLCLAAGRGVAGTIGEELKTPLGGMVG
ncbi:ATP-dependent helicase HrpA, partial [Pseudoxanthomonas taiwanensis J19]